MLKRNLRWWLISVVVLCGCGLAYAQSRPRAPQVGFGVLRVFEVTQVPYSALGNNTGNDCAAIQSAINDADNWANISPVDDPPIVYMPSGRYRCTTNLTLRGGVKLLGDFDGPINSDWSSTLPTKGTYFYVQVGANTNPFNGQGSTPPFEDVAGTDAFATTPFVTISQSSIETYRNNAAVEGIAFFYPDQETDGSPVPYPVTIGTTTGATPVAGLIVRNVTFINSYVALDLNAIEKPLIEGIGGAPLALGMRIRSLTDHFSVQNVKWHISSWDTMNDQTLDAIGVGPTNVRTWRARNFIGFMVHRVDGANFSGLQAFEGNRCIYFSDFQNDASLGWSQWSNFDCDGFAIPLEMDAIGDVKFSNCAFTASNVTVALTSMWAALLGDGTATGRVAIANCHIGSRGQGIIVDNPAFISLDGNVIRNIGAAVTGPESSIDIIRIAAGNSVVISNNWLDGSIDDTWDVRTGIRIEGAAGTDEGRVITGNVIQGVKTALHTTTAGDHVTFSDNRVHVGDPGTLAIDACGVNIGGGGATRAIVVSGNKFSGCGDTAAGSITHYLFVDADNVNISNNVFSGSTTISGDIIHLEGSNTVTRVNVIGNQIDQMGDTGDGILIEVGVTSFVVLGNTGFVVVDNSGAVTKYVAGNNI